MNVLFVTYDFPYPTNSGGKSRAFHLLKFTAGKANIFLYSFVRDDYNPEYNQEITSLGVKDIKVFKRKKLSSLLNFPKTVIQNRSIFQTLYNEKKVLEDLIDIIRKEHIDVVHFESTYTGFFIGHQLKKHHVKLILGTENIEYQLYLEYAKSLKKLYLRPFVYFQATRLKKEELAMVGNADAVTTITQNEADTLKSLTGKNCYIIANGVDPEAFVFNKRQKMTNNILFVGNFSYFPNVDAVNFFYNNVFHKLDKKITFTIVGKKSSQKFKFDDKRIVKKEFVEDIRDEYNSSDILVFPIRIGGGTNFKVLEAMSTGVPVVAIPQRLSGLNAVPGEHFLPADSAYDFCQQIERLYQDENLRNKITKNARQLVETQYAWKAIGDKLIDVWKKTL
jgi:glycosyltransferase involved in cell wall biosynthesis